MHLKTEKCECSGNLCRIQHCSIPKNVCICTVKSTALSFFCMFVRGLLICLVLQFYSLVELCFK